MEKRNIKRCGNLKNEIRKQNKLKRAQMTKKDVVEKSLEASNHLLASEFYRNCKTLMVYMPLGNETDTTKVIKQAYKDGKKVVFPVTDKESGIITPYYADETTDFVTGAFNVNEPQGGTKAELCDVDAVLVPGIAFDRKGARVGFGKGCYDRLLLKTDAIRIGFCYGFQICDDIPAEDHDIAMDFLVTENGILATSIY